MAENDEKKTLQETAAEIAGAGISSYTHGSRSVSKISPDTLLDVDARLRARAARRRGGLFVALNQGAGGGASPSPSPSPSGDWATKASVEAVSRRVATIEGDYVTGEEVPPAAVAAVQSANLSSLTLNGERITEWPEGGGGTGDWATRESVEALAGRVASIEGDYVQAEAVPPAAVAAVQSADLSSLTLNGERITEWPEGQAFIPSSRVVSDLSATVLETDYLIWFDSETAGDEQELTLPDMAASAMTIVVRHLGGDYPTTIRRGQRTYQLSGDGAAVAIDWLRATGEWYWRQAY